MSGNPLLEGLWTGNPWGDDGFPLPDVPEIVRQELYAQLIEDGLSDSEARGIVWPDGQTIIRIPITGDSSW